MSCISFETCLDQWYELDNTEDLISRLLKNDNLDIWNTELDLLNIDKEWEDMRGGERTVIVVCEDKNNEKGEKDKGVRRVRGKRQGKDKGSESTEKGEKEKGKKKTRVRGEKDKGRVIKTRGKIQEKYKNTEIDPQRCVVWCNISSQNLRCDQGV